MNSRITRVVVLGGGFGGVYAALELERRLGSDPNVELTLIHRDNFFLFTPMLHEVAASDLDPVHIVNPLRKLLRKTRLFHGEVHKIDLDARTLVVSHGADDGHEHVIEYDQLVVGLGSVTHTYGLPGVSERALTMKTLGDAFALRNRIVESLEEADFECCPRVRERMTTLVVAGGGFAGVETLAAIHDFAEEARPYYSGLRDARLRMVLVHSGDRLLPELSGELGEYARQLLEKRGVEVRLRTKVASLTDAGVQLSTGECIPARTLVWTAGTAPNPLLASLDIRKERGRIVVDEYLRAEARPGVWALGDCAHAPDGRGGTCPPTAQHASRQGKLLARNLEATLRGRPMKPFRFRTLGQLASLGRRAGVAEILGMRFSGFAAWWLWRTVYLAKLPRFERKVRVALDWTLDLLFSKDLVHMPTASGSRAVARSATSTKTAAA